MRGAERGTVITALCSAPRMGARSYIKALPFLLKQQLTQQAYQIYVTDTLRHIAANTARFAGGSYPENRFADLVYPPREETRTEEELIAQVRKGWR